MLQLLVQSENNRLKQEEQITQLVEQRTAHIAEESMKVFKAIEESMAALDRRMRKMEKRIEALDS